MCLQALRKLERLCLSHWRPYLPCRSSIMASVAPGDKTLHVPKSRLTCQLCYMFWSQKETSFVLPAGISCHGSSLADCKSESSLWLYFSIDPYFPKDSGKGIQLLCSLAGWSIAFHSTLCTVLWAHRQPVSPYLMSVKTSSVKAWFYFLMAELTQHNAQHLSSLIAAASPHTDCNPRQMFVILPW